MHAEEGMQAGRRMGAAAARGPARAVDRAAQCVARATQLTFSSLRGGGTRVSSHSHRDPFPRQSHRVAHRQHVSPASKSNRSHRQAHTNACYNRFMEYTR